MRSEREGQYKLARPDGLSVMAAGETLNLTIPLRLTEYQTELARVAGSSLVTGG